MSGRRIKIVRAVPCTPPGQMAVGTIHEGSVNESGVVSVKVNEGTVLLACAEFVWLDWWGFYEQSQRRGCSAYVPEPGSEIIDAINRLCDASSADQAAAWRAALARLLALLPNDVIMKELDNETSVHAAIANRGGEERQGSIRKEILELQQTMNDAFAGPAARILGNSNHTSARIAGALAALDEVLRLVPDTSDIPF